jgi:TonB family protein
MKESRCLILCCLVFIVSVSVWSQEPPPGTVFQPSPADSYKLGEGITPPKVIKSVDPKYSDEAHRARLEGNVVLLVVVDTRGKPTDIKVEKSLGGGLDEQAIKAVRKWRFSPGTKNGVPVDATIHLNMAFHLEEPLPTDLYKVGGDVSAPKVISQPDPFYSEAARQAKLQGVVVLKIVVDSNGKTKNIKVLRSLGGGLDEEAIEAVKRWKFVPAKKNGVPVVVMVTVEVAFHLY